MPGQFRSETMSKRKPKINVPKIPKNKPIPGNEAIDQSFLPNFETPANWVPGTGWVQPLPTRELLLPKEWRKK